LVTRNEGDREGGKHLQYVSDRGDPGLKFEHALFEKNSFFLFEAITLTVRDAVQTLMQ
jgi:hypothetical protein